MLNRKKAFNDARNLVERLQVRARRLGSNWMKIRSKQAMNALKDAYDYLSADKFDEGDRMLLKAAHIAIDSLRLGQGKRL